MRKKMRNNYSIYAHEVYIILLLKSHLAHLVIDTVDADG